jgi:hypothetical protein
MREISCTLEKKFFRSKALRKNKSSLFDTLQLALGANNRAR